MSGYFDMLQEVVEGLSRRGHSIEDRGADWIVVEDEDGKRFKVTVVAEAAGSSSGAAT